MPGTRDINDIKVVLLDEPVQVHPDQGLARLGSPMTKKPILDVLRLQRLTEKRVPAKINHAHRQIVASSPVGINLPQLFRRKRRQDFACASHRCSPRLNCARIIASADRCSSLEPKLFRGTKQTMPISVKR